LKKIYRKDINNYCDASSRKRKKIIYKLINANKILMYWLEQYLNFEKIIKK